MIKLLEGSDEILKEVKISSSTRRRESLGSLRKEVEEKEEKKRPPYVVGLTGGIASGKKQICQILKEQGCEVSQGDRINGLTVRIRSRPILAKEFLNITKNYTFTEIKGLKNILFGF